MTPELDRIYCGDALTVMRTWPDAFVHCGVTSPPYYGLRSYLKDDDPQKYLELGSEKTPEEYIEKMVAIFHEVKRVLRDDGVCFLNMGDSYAHSGPCGGSSPDGPRKPRATDAEKQRKMNYGIPPGLKPKDLCGMPWRLAFALQADGWWLRSDVIWAKPNPMPESVNGWRWEQHRVKVKGRASNAIHKAKVGRHNVPGAHASIGTPENAQWRDCPGCAKCEANDGLVLRKGSWRPTKAHEMVFMLAKSPDYFCDGEAVKEVAIRAGTIPGGNRHGIGEFKVSAGWAHNEVPAGRNLRSVWAIPTSPFPAAHFATFPPKLVEPCIKAGTSEKGCCPECGGPWVRVTKTRYTPHWKGGHRGKTAQGNANGMSDQSMLPRLQRRDTTLGWRPSCGCGGGPKQVAWDAQMGLMEYEPEPCICLDPFMGAGTVGLVARKLGRTFLGIELNPEYITMAEQRIRKATALPLFEGS